MNGTGKILSKIDDSSKAFQIKCLDGNQGKGIDIDTLYYSKFIDIDSKIFKEEYRYYILEYLKDESPYVSPWQSDPNKYKWNWKKFLSLYNLTKKLNGILVLVNYSDGFIKDKNGIIVEAPSNYSNEVRVMYVEKIDLKACELFSKLYKNQIKEYNEDYISFLSEKKMTLAEYMKWMQTLNNNCKVEIG